MSQYAALKSQIEGLLEPVAFKKYLEELTSSLEDKEVALKVHDACNAERNELLSISLDVEDSDDLLLAFACRYTQQKAKWIQLNLQAQYQTVMKGGPDPFIFYFASGLSNMLARIEPLVPVKYINDIQNLLAQPIDAFKDNIE